MLLKSWTFTTATLLLLTATAQVSAATSLADCKKLTDNFARLNCYDQLALASEVSQAVPTPSQSSAPTVSPTPVTATQVQTPVVAPAAPVIAVAATPATNAAVEFGMAAKRPEDEVAQIEAKVTAVKRNNYGKIVVTLENQHVWRQSDSDFIDMKVGDVAVIEKASLGSFLMSNGRDNRKIRVKRVE
jgi:hypothetical protein